MPRASTAISTLELWDAVVGDSVAMRPVYRRRSFAF
jgi:hypothetical protein